MTDGNNWYKYVIECATHKQAAEIAADKNLWLHAWTWLENTKMDKNQHRYYVNTDYLTEETKKETPIA